MTSQSSHYRGRERSSRRLAYLDLAVVVAYLIPAILFGIAGRWGLTAIWIVGVIIWAMCAWMNVDTARTWGESADMYEQIEAGTYWPVQR